MSEGKLRKRSWLIHDLAWKVRTKTLSAKLTLVFLGSRANDNGESWYSYSGIQRETGLCRDSIRQQIQYLKNELHILDWRPGGGRLTNRYRLNLEAMEQLVKKQEQESQQDGQQSAPDCQADSSLGCSVAGSKLSDQRSRLLDKMQQPAKKVAPGEQADTNPHGTLCQPEHRTLTEPGFGAVHIGNEVHASPLCTTDTVTQADAQLTRRAEAQAERVPIPNLGGAKVDDTQTDAERISSAITKMGLKNPDAWRKGIQSLIEAGEPLDHVLIVAESLHARVPAAMKQIDGSTFDRIYWFNRAKVLEGTNAASCL